MLMCKSIGYIYYCEELFVVKHKSKHSCASAIFYELGPSQVIRNCKFDSMYNETVPPVILDGGKDQSPELKLWQNFTTPLVHLTL